MKSKPIKILNYFMLTVYLYMVAVQYNDPDTLLWVAIYGIAAILCLFASLDKLHWSASTLLGLAALGWALMLAPSVIGNVSFGELFVSMEMKTIVIEQAREMGGLLIVAGWMTVLTLKLRQQGNNKIQL